MMQESYEEWERRVHGGPSRVGGSHEETRRRFQYHAERKWRRKHKTEEEIPEWVSSFLGALLEEGKKPLTFRDRFFFLLDDAFDWLGVRGKELLASWRSALKVFIIWGVVLFGVGAVWSDVIKASVVFEEKLWAASQECNLLAAEERQCISWKVMQSGRNALCSCTTVFGSEKVLGR